MEDTHLVALVWHHFIEVVKVALQYREAGEWIALAFEWTDFAIGVKLEVSKAQSFTSQQLTLLQDAANKVLHFDVGFSHFWPLGLLQEVLCNFSLISTVYWNAVVLRLQNY